MENWRNKPVPRESATPAREPGHWLLSGTYPHAVRTELVSSEADNGTKLVVIAREARGMVFAATGVRLIDGRD